MTAILRERPDLKLEQLQRTRQLMDKHAGDCLVTGFEKHIPDLILPDADDRHVLAAAIESGAGAVVTWNLSDFPESTLEPFGIELWTPDQLISQLIEEETEQMLAIMREHRASLKNPPRSPEEYLETLLGQGMKNTVAAISLRVGEI